MPFPPGPHPIDYPFWYDGWNYLVTIAHSYNSPSFFEGLKNAWGSDQAPVFCVFAFLLMKIFGFSYTNALLAQGAVTFFLALCTVWTLAKTISASEKGFYRSLFALIAVAVVTSGGIFHVMPGNLFDFRIDLLGSLLLSLALASWARPSWTSALFTGLAVCERFHNLAILAVTLVIWSIGSAMYGKRVGAAEIWRKIIARIKFPIYGLIGVAVVRAPALVKLAGIYLNGHFGLEKQLRGFGGWRSHGYFTYYPKTIYYDFIDGFAFWALAILAALAILFGIRKSAERAIEVTKSAVPLLIGSAVAFALLTIDPTRNNQGVIRFAYTPFLFGFAYVISVLAPVAIAYRGVAMDSRWARMALLSCFTFLAIVGSTEEYLMLYKFYSTFDYMDFRKKSVRSQMEIVYRRIYQSRLSRPSVEFTVGATFNNDLNFHGGQWEFFEANSGLKPLPYSFVLGNQFYAADPVRELLPFIGKLDYVAVGSPACRIENNHIPFNSEISAHIDEVNRLVNARCHEEIGQVELESCEIHVLACSG